MKLIDLKHLVGAGRHSLAGLQRAWSNEQAFRHEVLLLPVLVVLLCLIRPGFLWSALLAGGWLLVMSVELLNTAIEEALDFVSPDYSDSAKHGKNTASAAIFVALCANGLAWAAMLADQFL